MLARSQNHKKLAEYVGSCFKVYLNYNNRTYDVTNFTFGLPPVKTQLENETSGYGKAQLSRLSIDFDREEVEGFLSPLPDDSKDIRIVIKHYRRTSSDTYDLYTGVAEDLPSFIDSYSSDKLTLTFVSILGVLDDGDNIVDPNTGEEYRNISVDELIEAFDNEYGGSIRRVEDVPVQIRANEEWWSAYFRPFKKRTLDSETYDNTIKPKSIITDGTYIYYPVGNWIVRLDQTTKIEKIITRNGSGKEVVYLEYDSGDIHFITREDTGIITQEDIGKRGYGSFTIATVGGVVSPTEYFYKFDAGITIKAKNILRNNHRVSGDTDPALATWDTQMIGDGVVPPDKNLSTSRPHRGVLDELTVVAQRGLQYVWINGTLIDVPDGTAADWVSLIGWWCQIEGSGAESQQLGKCTQVIGISGEYQVFFENPLNYDFIIGDKIFFFPPEIWVSRNLFWPDHKKATIQYDKDELSDRDMQPVVIERRRRKWGRDDFYYPEIVAELSEGDEVLLEPEYYSFTSCDTAEEFTNADSHQEWGAKKCAEFSVELDWINRKGQYLLADNFKIENDMQPEDFEICGPNKVTLSGVQVQWNNGEDVKSYGNIFLHKSHNDKIFIGVNEIREANGGWYTRINLGVWDSALERFWSFYKSRYEDDGDNYQLSSPFTVKDDILYGGAKLYNKNWVLTGLQIIWARPPQGDFKPLDDDGSYTATVLIPGDHTDLFERGGRIRLGATAAGDTGFKEYFISESQVVTRDLTGDAYAVEAYRVKDKFTHLILKNIDSDFHGQTYQEQVTQELLGLYISVARGWDIRSVSYKWDNDLTVIDTATIEYGEEPEGTDDDLGETVTAEYDEGWDDSPRALLSESRVLTGVTVSLKKQDFVVTDLTDELRVTEPPAGEVYVKRNQGSDFKDTYIYFNDVYNNLDFKVKYSYYPDESEFDSFVLYNDKIYYNETGELNKWKVYDPALRTAENDSFSPSVKDTSFYSNVVELDGLWGFTEPSYALRRFNTEWSGYIEYAKTIGVRAWDILSYISSACNNALWGRNNEYIFKRRDLFDYRGELELHGDIKRTLITPFKKVTITYQNGQAVVGEGEPEYTRTGEYVSDYRHALIIANAVYNFYQTDIAKYEIPMLTFRDDIELLDMFNFYQGGTRRSGYVVEIGHNPQPPFKSYLVLYEAQGTNL